jgi:DNA invertase Pin-like site-specific DNA recombinase
VKAAIYARCSTTEQHPEAQLGPLRAWVAAHGHEVVEYVDEGESGAKARRPALDAMMAAVRRGEVQIVAVGHSTGWAATSPTCSPSRES